MCDVSESALLPLTRRARARLQQLSNVVHLWQHFPLDQLQRPIGWCSFGLREQYFERHEQGRNWQSRPNEQGHPRTTLDLSRVQTLVANLLPGLFSLQRIVVLFKIDFKIILSIVVLGNLSRVSRASPTFPLISYT